MHPGPAALLPDHATLRVLIDQLTDDQVAHVLRADHERWDDAQVADARVLTTPDANRRRLSDRFAQALAIGHEPTELARFQTLADAAWLAHPQPLRAVAAPFPVDPRVTPLVATLTDEQVAHVLRTMYRTWCSDEDPESFLSSPEQNRAAVSDTCVLNIGMGGELEFVTLEQFVAAARAAHPCPAQV